jgi:uncharacterized membrane protein YgcG
MRFAVRWYATEPSTGFGVELKEMASQRRCSALLVLFIAIATSFLLGDGTKHNFPRPTGYVNDFATVIDAGTKNLPAALCTEVDRKTNAQIAVVTVQTVAGSSIEDYALRLFNDWGIGHKEGSRGLLILLSSASANVESKSGVDSRLYFQMNVSQKLSLRWFQS